MRICCSASSEGNVPCLINICYIVYKDDNDDEDVVALLQMVMFLALKTFIMKSTKMTMMTDEKDVLAHLQRVKFPAS